MGIETSSTIMLPTLDVPEDLAAAAERLTAWQRVNRQQESDLADIVASLQSYVGRPITLAGQPRRALYLSMAEGERTVTSSFVFPRDTPRVRLIGHTLLGVCDKVVQVSAADGTGHPLNLVSPHCAQPSSYEFGPLSDVTIRPSEE
jgi:hypothetical protein